jgi:hypothetical protein
MGLLALPAAADHLKDFRAALDGLRANDLRPADRVFLKTASRDGTDRLLALYELGAFYHLGGNPKKSIECFNAADAVAHEYEGRAVISAGAGGRAAGAILLNDSVLRYEGFGYEKVMARTVNAINYLLLGDLEGARVEVRKAEEYQKLEREKHQREAQQAPPRGAEGASLGNPSVRAAYGPMFDFVKNVRNSFENAFTYYLSSQIYLVRGEPGLNDALVEAKRAFELAPQAPAVRSAYLDIARAQGGFAYDQAKALLQVDDAGAQDPGAGGSVVVFFETGLVPPMDEVKIGLYASNRLFNLAFPIYRDFGATQPSLSVATPTRTFTTSPILDTRSLAVKSLQERMPGILTRGLLGAIAKGEMQVKAEKEYGPFGGFLSQVASAVVTSADRRSWLSLPAEVQVARFNLPPGPNPIQLRGPGLAETVTVNAAPGSSTFVLVRAFPGFRRIDVRTFQAGDDGGPAPLALTPASLPVAPPPALQ